MSLIKLRLRLRVASCEHQKCKLRAVAEGFWLAELRVRQLKIGSKSCFGYNIKICKKGKIKDETFKKIVKPMEVKLRNKMSHWPKIPHRYARKSILEKNYEIFFFQIYFLFFAGHTWKNMASGMKRQRTRGGNYLAILPELWPMLIFIMFL